VREERGERDMCSHGEEDVEEEEEMLTLLSFIDFVKLDEKVLNLSSQLTVDLLGKEVFNLFS